ncbi:MAG: hypothetical protein KatS3mg015_3223 [Fimbriimonadales bacterium]|nr:MAG: hypothetical protein KatS3mg015_3223 [Fimbriimonadales bacterium]
MSELIAVDLFVEDRAHEEFLKPLLYRIASEEGVIIEVRVRSARGGRGRALQEFRTYQKLVVKGAIAEPRPDLVVVGIDGNCTTFAKKKKKIDDETDPSFAGRVVAACPDPHVERWYLADPESFRQVVGHSPSVGSAKCAREHYKRLLAEAVRQGGYPATLGGIEFATELAQAMDLYRAGKNDASLKAFLDDLRRELRRLKLQRGR